MTVLAAAAESWRSNRGILLLIAALAVICVLLWRMAVSEPDPSMAVSQLICRHIDAQGEPIDRARPIQLPYGSTSLVTGDRISMDCRLGFTLRADQVHDVSLFVLSFTDKMVIDVNNRQVTVSQLNAMRQLRWVTWPTLIQISRETVQVGENEIRIRLTPKVNAVSLDRIFMGPHAALRPHYEARWFTSVVMPTLLCGGELALAMVFGLIWAGRRGETAYGWLAAVLFLGALHGTVLIPDFGISDFNPRIWNLTVIWEGLAAMLFMRAIAGDDIGRRNWFFAIPPIFISLFALGTTSIPWNRPQIIMGAVAMVAALSLGIWSLARASLRGNRDAFIILLGIGLLIASMCHDMLMIFGLFSDRAFLGRMGLAAFLITVSTLMTLRFIRAMHEVDHTAEVLRQRVDAAEAELRDTYEELRIRREGEVVERERSRLMRDLHDGVGGELASMLALADSPRPRNVEIARHARAALSDMRLIISSLEDYGGDLGLALGAWRERAAPQVRAAGLALEWRVDDLPPLKGLGPAQVLDILRIIQEAVTNVAKHANATRIVLEAKASEEAITISVRDDGAGFAGDSRGNGLGNMAKRAERLGATLEIARQEDGTDVRLAISRGPARRT